ATLMFALVKNTQSAATEKTVELRSRDFPGYLLKPDADNKVWLVQHTNDDSGLWTMQSPGLNLEPNTVSLEYKAKPGYFLKSKFDNEVIIQTATLAGSSFEKTASWILLKDEYFPRSFTLQTGDTESVKLLRHNGFQAGLSNDDGTVSFKNAASFYLVAQGYHIHTMGGPVQVYDSAGGLSYMNIYTDLRFEAHGEVLVWRYRARNTNTFWADVWRPLLTGGYKLIGKNRIDPPGSGYHSYTVPFRETIIFQPGDVIGIHTAGQSNLGYGSSSDGISKVISLAMYDSALPVGKTLSAASICCRKLPLMAYGQQMVPISFNPRHGEASLLDMNKVEILDGNLNTCVDVKIGTTLKFDEDISGYSEYNIVVYTRGSPNCLTNHTMYVYEEVTSPGDFTGSFETCNYLDSKVVQTMSGLVTGCIWSCGCEANICRKGYVAIVTNVILCEVYIEY
ncbi:unnamed protein product, partial [Owenia fusiformis]